MCLKNVYEAYTVNVRMICEVDMTKVNICNDFKTKLYLDKNSIKY